MVKVVARVEPNSCFDAMLPKNLRKLGPRDVKLKIGFTEVPGSIGYYKDEPALFQRNIEFVNPMSPGLQGDQPYHVSKLMGVRMHHMNGCPVRCLYAD
jgi:hypothetical protein